MHSFVCYLIPTFRTPPPMLGMETPPNLQVYDLGHLGLVASVLDRIRLVETVDRLVGPRPGEKVSSGMALKAALSKMFP
jgi:hypothetical protein